MDGAYFEGRFRISPQLPSEQAVAEVRAWIAQRAAQASAPSAACPFAVYREDFSGEGQGRFQAVDVWAQELVSHLASKGHTCSGLIQVQGEDAHDHWALAARDDSTTVKFACGYVAYGDFQPVDAA